MKVSQYATKGKERYRMTTQHQRPDRQRQERWDRQHMRTACAKLRAEEVVEYRELCAAAGTTVHADIAAYIRGKIAASHARTPPPARRRGWF